LDAIVVRYLTPGETAFINTTEINAPSRRGIGKAGFRAVQRITRRRFAGMTRWSDAPMPARSLPFVWFRSNFDKSGGGERLALETLAALRRSGIDARVVAFSYDPRAVFDGRYDVPVLSRRTADPPGQGWVARLLQRVADVRWARAQIRALGPS